MTLMIDDRDLEKEPDFTPGAPQAGGPPLIPIAVGGALIILLIAAGGWWMSRREAPAAANTTPLAVNATEAAIEKPAEPPVVLPPLEGMDAFLRPLLAALSSSPELAAWLATDDLIRQLAAAIDQASAGATPARDLKILAPKTPFAIAGRAQRTIDAANYKRFDGLAATVTSIDAAAAAKAYRTIRPRLNEAYQGLGNPNRDVHNALLNTIDLLLDTPIVKPPVRLVAGDGASWAYADPELESLRPIQKQLIRMGPAHTEAIQTWLQAFRNAIQ
jgi:hypothetical protein